MKKIVGLFITLASFTLSAQQSKFANVYSFIENPAVFEINKCICYQLLPMKSEKHHWNRIKVIDKWLS